MARPRKKAGRAGVTIPADLPRGGYAAACHVPDGGTAQEGTRFRDPARVILTQGRARIPGAPFSRAYVRELRGLGDRVPGRHAGGYSGAVTSYRPSAYGRSGPGGATGRAGPAGRGSYGAQWRGRGCGARRGAGSSPGQALGACAPRFLAVDA